MIPRNIEREEAIELDIARARAGIDSKEIMSRLEREGFRRCAVSVPYFVGGGSILSLTIGRDKQDCVDRARRLLESTGTLTKEASKSTLNWGSASVAWQK